jgi:predicted permease
MSRFGGIRRAFRLGSARGELSEELAHHFESTVEELLAAGHSRAGAEAEARRRFGDERHWRREIERQDRAAAARRGWAEGWDALRWSVRLALRRMRQTPGFTAAVVLTFGLGIGVNATMFGIVDRLLLSPPAYVRDPDGVVRLMVQRRDHFTDVEAANDVLSYPDYEQFGKGKSFSSVAAVAGGDNMQITVGRGSEARQLRATEVTGNFFSLLGVHPALGRFFGPEEDQPGGAGVVVIGYESWQRRYGGDRNVLGRTLDFGQGPYTIIGVAPKGFTGIDLKRVDVWLPLHVYASQAMPSCWDKRNCAWLHAVARLAPGIPTHTAEAEATTLYRNGIATFEGNSLDDPKPRVIGAPLIAARGPNASSESKVAIWLAGIALIVLLIACANVANLLLSRSIRQRREIGIRLALGSSRGRVLGQVLTESVLFSLLGGIAAFLLAVWGGALLRHVLLPDIAGEWGGAESRIVGAVVFLSLLAGMTAGLVPAVQASRPELAEILKNGSRTSSPTSRTRDALTVAQAALSVVLLVGAGLFVHSLHRVNSLDLGLDPRGVLLVSPEFNRDITDQRKADFYSRALARLETTPGVEAVSTDISVPFWSSRVVDLWAPDVDSIPLLPSGFPILHTVDPGYFRVLDLKMRHGRGFGPSDRKGAPRVVVINETMAKMLWPGQNAIGKCLLIGHGPEGKKKPPCASVVGVVENARAFELKQKAVMQYYVPREQEVTDSNPDALLVRVRGTPASAIPLIQRDLLSLEPELRYVEARPLQELIDPLARSWKLGATMFTVFGLLALAVAGIGLYSVLAFSVAQRTFELGVRSALGAPRKRLLGLVLFQGARLAGIGIVLGLLIALLAAPKMADLLFETSPRDPLMLLGVAAVMGLVTVLAAALPALRATRVDPSIALRAE